MNDKQYNILTDLNVFMDILGMCISDSKFQPLLADSATVRSLMKQWSTNELSDDDFYAQLDPIVQKWLKGG